MDLEFKPGDRVRLTPAAIVYYGGNPKWIPESQGAGTPGTVLQAGDRAHDPRATPRPYFVAWDNGAQNSYRVDDLMLHSEEPEQADNIIPFRSK